MSVFEPYKIVYKPWGKEIWLDVNDYYCYKRIYINKGYRTSFQYHKEKVETNFIISGKAEVWLEDENSGEIKIYQMKDGDFFPVKPPLKHRVIALTDIVLQEVSTPQVDDVIRLQDDTNRKDGKINIEHQIPAVCILASGSGSRLKEFGKGFNKGLLKINNKAVISNIIEKFPKDYEIIITLGHYSNSLVEYCKAAHFDRKISFVSVENIDGLGSGPGTSALACKKYLQRPFYITTVDCLVDEKIPPLNTNWLGIYKTGIPEIYSTVKIDEKNNVIDFKNKSVDGFDYAFIGLSAILDYKIFWESLEKNIGNTGELVSAWYEPNVFKNLLGYKFNWYDVGTVDNYLISKEHFEKDNKKLSIEKITNERFYIVNNRFIKINLNKELNKNRINRSKILKDLIPNILTTGELSFSYQLVKGETLYDVDDVDIYKKFLKWCFKNLDWQSSITEDISNECFDFYYKKTLKRLEMLKENLNIDLNKEFIINGKKCKSCNEYISLLNWDWLCNGCKANKFHGDLQFDNIIYSNDNSFKFIDWRDSFSSQIEFGDCYYDLSKMYGGLEISYKIMRNFENNIYYKHENNIVNISYTKNDNLQKFKNYFEEKIENENFELKKIKIITAIIYLNMSPLHKSPMKEMLFFKFLELMENLND